METKAVQLKETFKQNKFFIPEFLLLIVFLYTCYLLYPQNPTTKVAGASANNTQGYAYPSPTVSISPVPSFTMNTASASATPITSTSATRANLATSKQKNQSAK